MIGINVSAQPVKLRQCFGACPTCGKNKGTGMQIGKIFRTVISGQSAFCQSKQHARWGIEQEFK
jgi:hypothetical protein